MQVDSSASPIAQICPSWNVKKVRDKHTAAERFEIATYCREFCATYKLAGIASFHESPAKMAPLRLLKRAVAGKDGGELREISYKDAVRHMENLRTSFMNTAVELMYLWPPIVGITRE